MDTAVLHKLSYSCYTNLPVVHFPAALRFSKPPPPFFFLPFLSTRSGREDEVQLSYGQGEVV